MLWSQRSPRGWGGRGRVCSSGRLCPLAPPSRLSSLKGGDRGWTRQSQARCAAISASPRVLCSALARAEPSPREGDGGGTICCPSATLAGLLAFVPMSWLQPHPSALGVGDPNQPTHLGYCLLFGTLLHNANRSLSSETSTCPLIFPSGLQLEDRTLSSVLHFWK